MASDFDPWQEQEEKNAHQMRIDDARKKYAGLTLHNLVKAMQEVRTQKDELEERLKWVNADYDTLRIELIPAKMEEDGVERISYEGIGRVSLTGDMNVRIKDKAGYFNWLRTNKLGDLIVETVNSSTLKAWVKNRIKGGKPVPEDLLDVKPFTRASITKG